MPVIPIVSIIICTCNRADDLRLTLASIAQVCVPGQMPTELLVVDNASTDTTAKVVASCHLPNMPVRYIHEPRRGKGYAYNTGMAAAQGEVFLFTDDDVRPPIGWIEGMCGPILGGQADAVAGGVRVAPHLKRPWMTPLQYSWMGSTEHLSNEEPGIMIGANMAFSRRVLEKVQGFDPELGPGALGFCDDGLFSLQLKAAGYKIAPAWQVSVEHHFQESRLTRDSLKERAVREGNSTAYLNYHWLHQSISLLGLRLAKHQAQLLGKRLGSNLTTRSGEGTPEWEMLLLKEVAFYQQYRRECRRERCYAHLGLKKRACCFPPEGPETI